MQDYGDAIIIKYLKRTVFVHWFFVIPVVIFTLIFFWGTGVIGSWTSADGMTPLPPVSNKILPTVAFLIVQMLFATESRALIIWALLSSLAAVVLGFVFDWFATVYVLWDCYGGVIACTAADKFLYWLYLIIVTIQQVVGLLIGTASLYTYMTLRWQREYFTSRELNDLYQNVTTGSERDVDESTTTPPDDLTASNARIRSGKRAREPNKPY